MSAPVESANTSLLGLRDYLRVLSRRRATILFAIFVVTAFTLASALVQTPRFASTASVIVRPSSNSDLFNANADASSPTLELQTQIEIVTSQPVKSAVQAELGSVPHVSVSPHGQADAIDISAQSTNAANTATIANTYAKAFINYLQAQDLDSDLAAESQIQSRISELQSQINGLNTQIGAATVANQASITATLGPQVDDLVQQQGTFKQQLSQIQVQAAVSPTDAQLVSPATIPTSPESPRPVRDAALAVLAGLLLGVGAAFALEYFDDSVKSRDDLDRALVGVRNLALIPEVPGWKDRDGSALVTLADLASPTAEAYRSLRTSLQFVSLERPLRTILVTSPSAREGKTTIVANLGISLAQVGQRVIIACCDLRRPRLHEFFGLENSIGFTSVLLGELPVFAALQRVEAEPNIRVLASGLLPPNPSELLSTDRAAEVLAALTGEADVVLIDSPPILPVTDAAILTRLVDATLLVVTVGSTTRRQISQALEILDQVDAPLLGTVLNSVAPEGAYGYAYSLYSTYPTDAKAAPRPPRDRAGVDDPPVPAGPPAAKGRSRS